MSNIKFLFVLSCWPTRDHIGRPASNSNSVMTSFTGSAKGCSNHRFRAPPPYTAQLVTLHQHRANSQYSTANQVYYFLGVSSSTQTTLEQCPIQELTELKVGWRGRCRAGFSNTGGPPLPRKRAPLQKKVGCIQWLYKDWYFQVDKLQRSKITLIVGPVCHCTSYMRIQDTLTLPRVKLAQKTHTSL